MKTRPCMWNNLFIYLVSIFYIIEFVLTLLILKVNVSFIIWRCLNIANALTVIGGIIFFIAKQNKKTADYLLLMWVIFKIFAVSLNIIVNFIDNYIPLSQQEYKWSLHEHQIVEILLLFIIISIISFINKKPILFFAMLGIILLFYIFSVFFTDWSISNTIGSHTVTIYIVNAAVLLVIAFFNFIIGKYLNMYDMLSSNKQSVTS